MKVLRVHITGLASSFRNPLFISGFQPTLPLPPLSALYGLLSAAKGNWVTPHDVAIGFVFQSDGKGIDLETIYEFDQTLSPKSNINKRQVDSGLSVSYSMRMNPNIKQREFLVSPNLYLYTPELWLREAFDRPHYPLLLGRSSDIATVKSIQEIELEKKTEAFYCDTLLPFPYPQIHGKMLSLPSHFSAEIPRRPCGTRAYHLITGRLKYEGDILYDPDMKWGVYLHQRIPGEFIVPVEKSTKPIDKDYKVPKINGEQMQLFDS